MSYVHYDKASNSFKTDAGRVADSPIKLDYVLASGSTEIVASNPSINDNSLIDVYTDKYGIAPTNITQNGSTLTLTFDAQSENVNIRVVVR